MTSRVHAHTDRALQQLAKAAGIRANASKAELIDALQRHETGKENSPANQKPWLPRICGGGHSLHVTLCKDSGIAKKPEIASEMVTLSSWAEARCWTRTSTLHPIAGCLSP